MNLHPLNNQQLFKLLGWHGLGAVLFSLGHVLIFMLYRRWLASRETVQQPADYPEIILASQGNKDKALRLTEVEWIQAAGNYASLITLAGNEIPLGRSYRARLLERLSLPPD